MKRAIPGGYNDKYRNGGSAYTAMKCVWGVAGCAVLLWAAPYQGGADARPEMPVEEVVAAVSPAVVRLEARGIQGTGFFLADSGLIATNAHVVSGQSSLTVIPTTGTPFSAAVVHVEPALDVALLEPGAAATRLLTLSDDIRVGQSVIAIGNPSGGMPNSVTRGIVSGVGSREGAVWIQTDAAVNPGNSGGPLLNTRGEVIGINMKKLFLSGDGRPLQGISFALAASELRNVLNRYLGTATISFVSEPAGGEILVDGSFVGNTPSTLKLCAGSHMVQVRAPGYATWERQLRVLRDSQLSLKADLEKAPRPAPARR